MKINKIENNNIQTYKTNTMQAQNTKKQNLKFAEFSTEYSNAQKALGLSFITFKGKEEKEFKKEIDTFKKTLKQDKLLSKDEIKSFTYCVDKENFETRKEAYNTMKNIEDFPKKEISSILNWTNNKNLSFVQMMCEDKEFPKEQIKRVLFFTNEENLSLAQQMCQNKDFPKEEIRSILCYTNAENAPLVQELCDNKDFPKEKIKDVIKNTNETNLSLARKLCEDKEFPKENIGKILCYTNDKNVEAKIEMFNIAKKVENFPKKQLGRFITLADEENIHILRRIV